MCSVRSITYVSGRSSIVRAVLPNTPIRLYVAKRDSLRVQRRQSEVPARNSERI